MNGEALVRGWDYPVAADDVSCCKACGGENLHLARVRVNQGGAICTIDESGPTESRGAPSGRGTSIGITVWCEDCPATHIIVFQFHKGTLLNGVTRGEDREAPDRGEEMWRD
jgi:hypothetical protein